MLVVSVLLDLFAFVRAIYEVIIDFEPNIDLNVTFKSVYYISL